MKLVLDGSRCDGPDAVLRLPPGDQEGYLHHERSGIDQCPAQEGHEAPGRFSYSRLREEGVVLGHHESQSAVDPAHLGLGFRPQPSDHRFRRPDTRLITRPFTEKTIQAQLLRSLPHLLPLPHHRSLFFRDGRRNRLAGDHVMLLGGRVGEERASGNCQVGESPSGSLAIATGERVG